MGHISCLVSSTSKSGTSSPCSSHFTGAFYSLSFTYRVSQPFSPSFFIYDHPVKERENRNCFNDCRELSFLRALSLETWWRLHWQKLYSSGLIPGVAYCFLWLWGEETLPRPSAPKTWYPWDCCRVNWWDWFICASNVSAETLVSHLGKWRMETFSSLCQPERPPRALEEPMAAPWWFLEWWGVLYMDQESLLLTEGSMRGVPQSPLTWCVRGHWKPKTTFFL